MDPDPGIPFLNNLWTQGPYLAQTFFLTGTGTVYTGLLAKLKGYRIVSKKFGMLLLVLLDYG
jgi:hypothetical protein